MHSYLCRYTDVSFTLVAHTRCGALPPNAKPITSTKIDSDSSSSAASPTQPELKSARLMARNRKVLTPDSMPDGSSTERLGFEVNDLWYLLSQSQVAGCLI